MSFFVTGTDTDVGKTFFAALFVRALRDAGIDAVGFKPIACGGWEDVDALIEAGGGGETRTATCPIYLEMPASPLTASWAEETRIDPAILLEAYRDLAARHEMVVVEGAGGWLVPITPDYAVADLAAALALPVIVVVRNRLGALNHTLLTIESITRRGLDCAGIVLNDVSISRDLAAHSNRATFELLRSVPVLCELTPGQAMLELSRFDLPGLRRECA